MVTLDCNLGDNGSDWGPFAAVLVLLSLFSPEGLLKMVKAVMLFDFRPP